MTITNPPSSEFFSIAGEVDLLSGKSVDIERENSRIQNACLYSPAIGKESPAVEMETSLGLDNASVVVLSTAEAEAIGGAGLFTYNSGELRFCLPRFHIGPAAQLDMTVAIAQLARTRLMKQIINDSNSDNSGIIQFSREGHLASWQIAVWLASGKNIPTTLVKISHLKSDNLYTRIAHIDGELNLEGFPTTLTRLFVCDPVASGMQHVAMIEYLERIKRLPEEIVIIAPMSTLFGLQVIALSCQKRGIRFRAGVLGTLLDSNPPLRYFSPYPKSVDQAANKDLALFTQGALGNALHQWCIRCNWTASFMGGTKLPRIASDEELHDLGLTHEQLTKLQDTVSFKSAEASGVSDFLLPYSTRLAQSKITL